MLAVEDRPELLPSPKKLIRTDGTLFLPNPFILPSGKDVNTQLEWDLGKLSSGLHSGTGTSSRPGRARESILRLELNPRLVGQADEAYVLTISPVAITVQAASLSGLRMGLRTLTQIVEQQKGCPILPCLRVEDRPALAFRAVHLDMKNIRYSRGYWTRIFDRLAAMKVNGAVLEQLLNAAHNFLVSGEWVEVRIWLRPMGQSILQLTDRGYGSAAA